VRLAGELAHAAFEQAFELPVAWTDSHGTKHKSMTGRPVSMHAMRGISAHSNGFHTCRSIHILQILLGTIDVPGGFLYKPPFPKAAPPGLKPAGKVGEVNPLKPLPGPPLGFVAGPEDLLVNEDGSPRRIDKAYSWDAPIAAHGLMHTVITNAANKDPYGIDVLFMYMANMSWNSTMNSGGIMDHLTKTTRRPAST
jgi:anaerobic selenocysteine-containing dehydrogenase